MQNLVSPVLGTRALNIAWLHSHGVMMLAWVVSRVHVRGQVAMDIRASNHLGLGRLVHCGLKSKHQLQWNQPQQSWLLLSPLALPSGRHHPTLEVGDMDLLEGYQQVLPTEGIGTAWCRYARSCTAKCERSDSSTKQSPSKSYQQSQLSKTSWFLFIDMYDTL